MNNIDKYKATNLCNAIEDAVDVSFSQMIETIKTQCYMSQTETNWEDCDELTHLEDLPIKLSNGDDVKLALKNRFKRLIISSLTDSDWVTLEDTEADSLWISDDEIAKRNPNKFRKPTSSLDLANSLSKNKGDSRWNMCDKSIKNVTILALETLLEQVRDARDFEQIGRVKNVLDIAKSTECDDNENREHKNSDKYQSQFETETERLEREDEEENDISPNGSSKPSDSFGWDTPQIDGIPNGDTMSDTDDEDDLF